ncbi:MAG: phosphoglucosamine mutase, partial [Gemmatimonadota bacterium]|nr:phosphoglucosamine mutase [Gemmatimonadota bacterium]
PGAADRPVVLLGRDSRTSGPLLVDAAAAGLQAVGADVRDTGIAPTPTHLLAVRDDPATAGGLIVTASHNPVEWNGLKLAGPDGRFVAPHEGREVHARFEAGVTLAAWDEVGTRTAGPDVAARHVERILSLDLVDAAAVRSWAPLVVLDAVHGAGGPLIAGLLRELGCRVEGMGLEPDGRFPREPEPIPENLGALGDRVRSVGADLGLAVDPDSDRLAIVDESGRPVGEDWTLAFAVEYVLRHRRGPVVTNLSSSQCIEDAARSAGAPFHRTAVGEARVAAGMAEVGAVIGGEGNGGVILPDLNLTRDAPLAAALVLSLFATERAGPGRLLSQRRRYHLVKRRMPRPAAGTEAALAALAETVPEGGAIDRTDGLRVAWPARREWVHVRASGTEPILRVISEAPEAVRAVRLADWAEEGLAAADVAGRGT